MYKDFKNKLDEATKLGAKDGRIKLEKPTLYVVDPSLSEPVLLGYVVSAMKAENFEQNQIEAFTTSVIAYPGDKTHAPKLVDKEELVAKARMQIQLCNEHLLGRIPQEIKDKYNL